MGNYSTNQAAAKLGLSPNTLREAHCTKGSYFGVKPLKCHNRMLRWPAGLSADNHWAVLAA